MRIFTIILALITLSYVLADVAPNPIFINSIINNDSTFVQMVNEVVIADVYKDSAYVDCLFTLKNHSEKTELTCGFPVMSFYYHNYHEWNPENDIFQVWINDIEVEDFKKYIPEKIIKLKKKSDNMLDEYLVVANALYDSLESNIMDSLNIRQFDSNNEEHVKIISKILNKYEKEENNRPKLLELKTKARKLESEVKVLVDYNETPWYLWEMGFDCEEEVLVRVKYKLPSGAGYYAAYRYFKYILHTGAGWYRDIEYAKIIINVHNIHMEYVEIISPKDYILDFKANRITWEFNNIEPNKNHDIYLQYYDKKERKFSENYPYNVQRKMRRRNFIRKLNPFNWF